MNSFLEYPLRVWQYRQVNGVWIVRLKQHRRPKQRNQVRFSHVGNAVSHSRRDFHYLNLFSADSVCEHLVLVYGPQADLRLPLQNNKLFYLYVVEMIASGDARFGFGNKNLPNAGGFDALKQQPRGSVFISKGYCICWGER